MKPRAESRPPKPNVPAEFRRLGLHCPTFKEITAEYEAGQFSDWETALSTAVFALAAELENAHRQIQETKGAA